LQTHVDYAAGVGAGALTAGDFNGDGKIDLACGNFSANTVSVLLGNGDGTFQTHVDYGTGTGPSAVVTADLNGDGKLDLAATNLTSNTVSILLGNGNGTFQTHVDYATGSGPNDVALGDLNGDGILDLAVANSKASTFSWLLGNGNGSFQTHMDVSTGTGPSSVGVADFNGDGRLDVGVADRTANTVSVLLQVPGASLLPGSLSFGNQTLGTTSSAQTATLTNTGSAPLAITSIGITGANSGDFNQTNTCGTTLAGGASCSISVTFTPQVVGSLSATLSVSDDASGSPQTVSLSGTGVGIPVVQLSPTSLTFATQLINTSSAAQNVTLTNTGNGTLTITSIGISGGNSTDFSQTNNCGTSVAAGASCTISVTFKPTAKGSRSSSVSIVDNASNSPQSVPLSGTCTQVLLSTTALNFGDQRVGTTSAALAVTVTNKGTGGISITNIGISGRNAGDFAETNTCGTTLGAGQACTIDVTFTPRAQGSRTASLSITDTGGGSPQTVSLSGTGTGAE
jgi:hypothetical protein